MVFKPTTARHLYLVARSNTVNVWHSGSLIRGLNVDQRASPAASDTLNDPNAGRCSSEFCIWIGAHEITNLGVGLTSCGRPRILTLCIMSYSIIVLIL